jgi:hypothetical protein
MTRWKKTLLGMVGPKARWKRNTVTLIEDSVPIVVGACP